MTSPSLSAPAQYALALAAVACAWLLREALNRVLGPLPLPYPTFFLAVALSAWLGGTGPGLLAIALASVISWYSFPTLPAVDTGARMHDISGLAAFIVVSLVIVTLSATSRRAYRQAREVAQQAERYQAELQKTLTGRQVVEAELKRQYEWFRITFGSIGDSVITTDPAGKVLYLNPAAERLTGWPAVEAEGEPLTRVLQLVNERTRRAVETPVEQVLESGTTQDVSHNTMLVARDGTEHYIDDTATPIRDANGAVAGVVLTIRDVTLKRHLEKDQRRLLVETRAARDDARIQAQMLARRTAELEQSEARFRTMADGAPVMIRLTGTSKSAYYFNRAWAQFTGRTLEEESGFGWNESVHPDDYERCMRELERAFDAREPCEIEYRMRRHDGEYRWVVDRGVPLFGTARALAGYIDAVMDITDLKRAQETLASADRKKNQFIAMLGHELRNPLAPIRNASLIVRRLAASPPVEITRALDAIDRQSEHLVRLVDDLLDASRIETGKIMMRHQPTTLQHIVERAVELSQPIYDAKAQRIEVRVPDAAISIDGDVTRLVQALSNVLHNASKYSDEGARVELSIAETDGDAEIRVKDYGKGISAEFLPRIYDLFAQAEHATGGGPSGLGIGLTMARKIIELHRGTIVALSDGPGRGSEFVLRMPVSNHHAPVAVEAAPSVAARSQDACRVLVVDDNVDSAETTSQILMLNGHETSTAFDGAAALKAVASFRPEIVLLDIGLPLMNGYEVARRLREQDSNRDLFLVALTGYGQADDRTAAFEAGFDRHLVKPIDPLTLDTLIAEFIARRAARA